MSDLIDRLSSLQNVLGNGDEDVVGEAVSTIAALEAQVAELRLIISNGKLIEKDTRIGALEARVAALTAERDAQALRQHQQSDLIRTYTDEGVRQRQQLAEKDAAIEKIKADATALLAMPRFEDVMESCDKSDRIVELKQQLAAKDARILELEAKNDKLVKNITAIETRRMQQQKDVNDAIIHGLRDCIHAHGPIDAQWITSATKRIQGYMCGLKERWLAENEERNADYLSLREKVSHVTHERNQLRSTVEALEARLQAAEGKLAHLCEPGTPEAVVNSMFDEAEKRGQSPVSSKHALSFLLEKMDRTEAKLQIAVEDLQQIFTIGTYQLACDLTAHILAAIQKEKP